MFVRWNPASFVPWSAPFLWIEVLWFEFRTQCSYSFLFDGHENMCDPNLDRLTKEKNNHIRTHTHTPTHHGRTHAQARVPTHLTTYQPTNQPTDQPTDLPTNWPTYLPTDVPSRIHRKEGPSLVALRPPQNICIHACIHIHLKINEYTWFFFGSEKRWFQRFFRNAVLFEERTHICIFR